MGIPLVFILTAMISPANPFVIKFFMNFPLYLIAGMILSAIVFGVLPAINAIKVFKGKKPWGYPLKINFFK
jgi:hypothetical protein